MTTGLVLGRMERWRVSGAGRCPRTDGPHCSAYGIAAVRRWGAVLGVLAAARYVATCSVGPGSGPGNDCHRSPTSRLPRTLRVLVLFARLALLMPGQLDRDDGCGNDR